jgi:hypothetical protein
MWRSRYSAAFPGLSGRCASPLVVFQHTVVAWLAQARSGAMLVAPTIDAQTESAHFNPPFRLRAQMANVNAHNSPSFRSHRFALPQM